MTRGLFFTLTLALTLRLAAQLPPAPKPHLDRVEWALLTAEAGSRALDVYSTHVSLAAGNHEVLLPDFIANHTPVLAAYSGGVVALDWLAVRELERHHHRRWAHALPAIDIANDLPWAIRNLRLGRSLPVFNPPGPGAPVRR